MKVEKIYNEIKNSLGELQYEYFEIKDKKDIKSKKLAKWLDKRIKYLKGNPDKIKSIGVVTANELGRKNIENRIRVEGFKKIKLNILKNIINQ